MQNITHPLSNATSRIDLEVMPGFLHHIEQDLSPVEFTDKDGWLGFL